MSGEEVEDLPSVEWDVPEYDYDLASVDGKPFTGFIVEHHDNGAIASRRRYRDGLPEGLSEEWYPDGQIARRWHAIRGQGSSESWKWYPSGQMWSYRRDVNGLPAELKEWNEDGSLVLDETRDPPGFRP